MSPQIVNLDSGSVLCSSLAAGRQIASSTHVSLRESAYVADRLVIRESQENRLLVSADIMAVDSTLVIHGKLVDKASEVMPVLLRIAARFNFPAWAVDHCLMQLQGN